MDSRQTRIAFYGPLATAFIVYAAILLTGKDGGLSWDRFLIGAVVCLGISGGGAWVLRRHFEKRGH